MSRTSRGEGVLEVTDLEISKALALAIGWSQADIIQLQVHIEVWWHNDEDWEFEWRKFDYRDWNVVGPIAERYNLTVDFALNVAWTGSNSIGSMSDSPQKAIAMAVIEGAKK